MRPSAPAAKRSALRPSRAPFPPRRPVETAPAARPSPSETNPPSPAPSRGAAFVLSDWRLSVHVIPINALLRGRARRRKRRAVAHARLPSRCLRRPHLPGHDRIDDPGVLDELALPTVSWVPYNSDGAHEWDASFSWTKTITPGLSVVISDGPTWEHPGG